MRAVITKVLRGAIRRAGFDVVRFRPGIGTQQLPRDFEPEIAATVARVRPFTMTSPERIYALCKATEYVVAREVPGAIVECGVWRGGSMMAVAATLLRLKRTDRELYLFDTFAGMPEPGPEDVRLDGKSAADMWRTKVGWCAAGIDEVHANLCSVGYPSERMHLVKGLVEETVPAQAPAEIALLRLDTDWYQSTRHELEHLFPRLQPGGVILIDDYGHWRGSRKAVDEYFAANGLRLLLNRIDDTGRIAVKL